MNELLAQCERDEASSAGGKPSINEVASLRASLKELYDKRAHAERNMKNWLDRVQMKEGVYLPGEEAVGLKVRSENLACTPF